MYILAFLHRRMLRIQDEAYSGCASQSPFHISVHVDRLCHNTSSERPAPKNKTALSDSKRETGCCIKLPKKETRFFSNFFFSIVRNKIMGIKCAPV